MYELKEEQYLEIYTMINGRWAHFTIVTFKMLRSTVLSYDIS